VHTGIAVAEIRGRQLIGTLEPRGGAAMENVQQDVKEIIALVPAPSSELISDEVARALFREWKTDLDLSIGDLLRAVESKGRQAAIGPDKDPEG